MQRINEDIKSGNFRQMYLLYGEEAYLRKQYRDRLKKAMISDDDTMNYSYLEGKDISIGAVIDLAETLPFFADRRVVVVKQSVKPLLFAEINFGSFGRPAGQGTGEIDREAGA